jgi:DNA-binding MarR family transcriptional regulator
VHASSPHASIPTTPSEALAVALGDELLTTVLRIKRIGGRVLDEWHTQVTMPQLAVLGRLHSYGPQRLSTIADWSQLDRSSASRQITELADRGLVERLTDPLDGRARLLQLTELGAGLLAQVECRRDQFFRHALRDWSDDDIATLHRLLHRLNEDVGDTVAQDAPTSPG